MKIKISDLIGPALDWAVAKCEEQPVHWCGIDHALYCGDGQGLFAGDRGYSPSTNWAQGGPIIEREGITIERFKDSTYWSAFQFSTGHCEIRCESPLIAAMHCYVASKLGDEVEIPAELVK